MVLQFAGVPAEAHVSICAIGASAGGVGALRILLRQLPANLGMAYVVILNHSLEKPAALAQTLRSCTRMDVLPVDDSVRLNADCVYIIPPDRELLIKGDQITARAVSERQGPRAPVDQFFRSVAQARGDGLAVILSGSGADGSNGLRAIHEGGGVIFAQEPTEAEFPPMPQNAIATGLVNFVAPIPRLAERIAEVAYRKQAMRSFDIKAADDELRPILGLLRARTGHDFASYKRATVMHRVVRRMQVCGLDTLSAYGDLVSTDPEESQALFFDLLISVTHFFRDQAAFGALERQVLAPLLDTPTEEGIRIWVAGCATGEEAYSLAILMLEQMAGRRIKVPVQIFASDLDARALHTAHEGRYPRSIEADVSEERLRRFFIDERTHYRIRKEVRDLVDFASHSVLQDPPYLRLDLVSCRNLLTYLEPPLQHQVLRMLHCGLRPQGSLFLGSAETADACADFFAPIDGDARIYRARDDVRRELPEAPRSLIETPDLDQARLLRAELRAAQEALTASRKEHEVAMSDLHAVNRDLRTENAELKVKLADISTADSEQQLLESRERYQILFNSIDEGFCLIDMIFDADDRPCDFRFVEVNATFERQTGLVGVVGRTIREFAPNHEQHWFDTYGRIVRSGIPERFQAPAAALGRHFELYGFPHGIQGSDRVGVLFRDVTQRKVAEEQREMLTHELSHRVKNTLAVVQALARQPGTPQMSVETYRDRLIGRIQALSRAHEQLLETSWESADLKLLVEATLSAYGRIGDRGIVIKGPMLRLTPKQGLGLSLILHELATNASKYGALSVGDGHLSVAWAIVPSEAGAQLDLTWSERDGPEIPAAVGRGFGTALIERASSYELDGKAVLDFSPQGLQASISFPYANPGLDS